MSKLFILGAGFSKAVSDKMPTMKDLGKFVRDRIPELPGDPQIYYRLMSDPSNVEELLTYLYQEMPWKTAEQTLIEKAAFHKLSAYIVEHIAGFESELTKVKRRSPHGPKTSFHICMSKKQLLQRLTTTRSLRDCQHYT